MKHGYQNIPENIINSNDILILGVLGITDDRGTRLDPDEAAMFVHDPIVFCQNLTLAQHWKRGRGTYKTLIGREYLYAVVTCMRERERDREREGERHRERDTQIDRQTDRQSEGEKTEREGERETDRQQADRGRQRQRAMGEKSI